MQPSTALRGGLAQQYTLVLINVVTLHQVQLMPGWVNILGRVNHLGTEPVA